MLNSNWNVYATNKSRYHRISFYLSVYSNICLMNVFFGFEIQIHADLTLFCVCTLMVESSLNQKQKMRAMQLLDLSC